MMEYNIRKILRKSKDSNVIGKNEQRVRFLRVPPRHCCCFFTTKDSFLRRYRVYKSYCSPTTYHSYYSTILIFQRIENKETQKIKEEEKKRELIDYLMVLDSNTMLNVLAIRMWYKMKNNMEKNKRKKITKETDQFQSFCLQNCRQYLCLSHQSWHLWTLTTVGLSTHLFQALASLWIEFNQTFYHQNHYIKWEYKSEWV